MRRREFTTLLGGALSALSFDVRAQERIRRIGVLMGYGEDDAEGQSSVAAFVQGLRELGWVIGRNVLIDYRWSAGDVGHMNMFADELVTTRPDVILAHTTPVTGALHKATGTLPIVFAAASDPVGDGFIASLSRPGGNITGFVNIEGSMGGKWMEILKEIDPRVKRVAFMFNPDTAPAGGKYFAASFDAATKSLGVEQITAAVRSDGDIESVLETLGREPGGGLVATADGFNTVHRKTIIAASARSGIPTTYHLARSAREGGLVSYGADVADIFRRCSSYVDRILRGARPSDLPAQVPTKFEFVINLKTAKSLSLIVPPTLLARADEVIE